MAEVVESKVCDAGILQSSFEGSADALERTTLIGKDMSGDGFIMVMEGLETEAREGRKGLWADLQPMPPLEWRKKQRH
ncbi:MAG: hypothetical protein ABIR36_12795 [Nitrospiraceae bacterium]